MMDSTLLSSAIKSAEHQYVAVIDLLRAFLCVNMAIMVHIVLCGELADLMAATAHEIYYLYVTYVRNGDSF